MGCGVSRSGASSLRSERGHEPAPLNPGGNEGAPVDSTPKELSFPSFTEAEPSPMRIDASPGPDSAPRTVESGASSVATGPAGSPPQLPLVDVRCNSSTDLGNPQLLPDSRSGSNVFASMQSLATSPLGRDQPRTLLPSISVPGAPSLSSLRSENDGNPLAPAAAGGSDRKAAHDASIASIPDGTPLVRDQPRTLLPSISVFGAPVPPRVTAKRSSSDANALSPAGAGGGDRNAAHDASLASMTSFDQPPTPMRTLLPLLEAPTPANAPPNEVTQTAPFCSPRSIPGDDAGDADDDTWQSGEDSTLQRAMEPVQRERRHFTFQQWEGSRDDDGGGAHTAPVARTPPVRRRATVHFADDGPLAHGQ